MAFMRLLMTIVIVAEGISTSDATSCMRKLGISNSSIIKDNQMSATSYLYSDQKGVYHFKPYYGRLHTRSGGGSWCSAASSKKEQFIQVDFLRNIRIRYIETQGRFRGAEYVSSYKVRYQRSSDVEWRLVLGRSRQEKVFPANNDTDSVVGNYLPHSIVARRVRIYPTGDLFAIHCLRLEMYGCQLQTATRYLVSYTSPVGIKLGKFDFTDSSFDGTFNKNKSIISNGLGRLSDGLLGSNDFTGWVGFNISRIETIFQFAKARSFSEAVLYTRTLSGKDIFVDIHISLSMDGMAYKLAKNVSGVRVKTTGTKIRIELQVAEAYWLKCIIFQQPNSFLLISEIVFGQDDPKKPTTPAKTITLEKSTEDVKLFDRKRTRKIHFFSNVDKKIRRKEEQITLAPSDDSGQASSRGGSKRTKSFYIIVGVATFVAAVFTLLIFLLVYFLKRDKSDAANARKQTQKQKRGSDATKVGEPLLKTVDFQGVCGTSRYASPAIMLHDTPAENEISRTAIQFENKIGGGKFGEVFIGQIVCPKDGTLTMSRHSLIGQKVFIQILKKGASVEVSGQLIEEIQVLSCLRHPNICRLIAVCNKSEPKLLLSECLEGMRLDSYLTSLNLSATTQKCEILADIVVKVADALKYLASVRIVHRDIAARNVIFGIGSVVKLTNTAAACPGYYDCYYYLKDKHCLHPIRWMAPETLTETDLTVQSDVWSFGVLLWEIYTFAKLMPFETMGNQEILQQLEKLNTMGPRSVEYLPLKFLNCPVLIWRVIRRCWTVGPAQRITADQIYQTLTS